MGTTFIHDTLPVLVSVGGEEAEIEVEVSVRVYSGCDAYWSRSAGMMLPGDDPSAELVEALWNKKPVGDELWDALYGMDWSAILAANPQMVEPGSAS